MFTDRDIKQIHDKGISLDQVNAQIKRLKNGMSHSNLVAAATLGKGIEHYDEREIQTYIELYEVSQKHLSIVKFVPASGAATRMFKFLFQFIKNFNPSKESIDKYVERQNDTLIEIFADNLEKFPFYTEVIEKVRLETPDFNNVSNDKKLLQFVKIMLDDSGLNYNFLPKGLFPFHKYGASIVTAFQEHLVESALYGSSNGVSNLHFTVSEKHHNYFLRELNQIREALEKHMGTTFNVSFSYQQEITETVALVAKDKICRKEDNSILFRPAGHGALLENLNDLNNDIIFIKNIDNVVVSNKNAAISYHKKLLAGVLLEAQQIVFSYLNKLDDANLTESDFKVMLLFLRYRLNVSVNINFDEFTAEEKTAYLRKKLNRPIRVCGMVKNEGEPGGGPFWVKDKNGEISLQIVEFAQIDFSRKNQQSIVYKATHFNPTDLVCGVKNYKGEKFDLKEFVDPEAAFITKKTHDGVEIKALELPGLWNGSMAHWNSIFVEVPLETFNSVKTVNDLLKPAHQSIS
ncbi:DUF4301 family protein [Tamlana sp. 2201CG12-4]|uniref:DUF4301 family protein n=1 Tax=Tamlana sp. 2201CG12-4 TaxID=3112582 RepID=UPI002DC042C6|nr:DUF4301 family protein [Tamlana sp. 2201CG12-4]MEC3906575.1 DUF4301 family protein [Tamlana sp. 2201CG12-4]